MKLAAYSRGGSVRVHRTGCRDTIREAKVRDLVSNPQQDFESQEAFGLDYWSDINAEHAGLHENEDGSDIRYVYEDIEFLPCTKGLPVTVIQDNPYAWVLKEAIWAEKHRSGGPTLVYDVERIRAVILRHDEEHLLFNGEYVDVGDDYTRYVALMDEATFAFPGKFFSDPQESKT